VATLHVTSGDSVLYSFRKAGITGEYLAWHDVLFEGPVPAQATLEETSAVRVGYLAARGYGRPIKIIAEMQRRDAMLRRAAEFDEVVLWFEHDLYDQLHLLQILTALEGELELGRTSLIQTGDYLGMMTADEISPLLGRRRTVTPATFTSARRAWERFTSPSAAKLHASAMEDAIGLPFLRSALRRLCEEYPWRRDGLSRSQRQALQAIAQGPGTVGDLFRRSQAREEASFLGEAAFSKVVEDLRSPRLPLIEGDEEALIPTALGRLVLAGDADWLEGTAIDRWIGGVHLCGADIPRWDDDAARFV
jgi:hypothetical protein